MTRTSTTANADHRPDHVRIFEDWHTCAKSRLVDELASLYAIDAVLESPLIPALLDIPRGVCHGRRQIQQFLAEGTKRRPNELVQWHRSPTYLWDGATLSWEYPRQVADGEQIDIAEYMDIAHGYIQRHRIYWGWFGLKHLLDNALSKADS